MPMSDCLLNLDRTQRELSPHGTPDFPCACYDEVYSSETEHAFPWHWHEEIELLYIAEGTMSVQIPGRTFDMHEGDSVFINSGVLHYGSTKSRCRLYSLVFSPLLLSGSHNSAIDKKYVQPVTHYSPLDGYVCSREITACIISAFTACRDDADGFEFTVRDNLSQLIFHLYEQNKDGILGQTEEQNEDSERMRKMLTYIHEHFSEQVTLAQIAETASVGERECLRCFQRSIQISPLQYVIMYRLRQSASMLLESRHTDIAAVAYDCGFASPGSFTQLFRRYYQCTPREYRQLKRTRL